MYDKRISKAQRDQIVKARRGHKSDNLRESQRYLNAVKHPEHFSNEYAEAEFEDELIWA